MRVLSLREPEGIDALEVVDAPTPQPGDDEVVVTAAAATINPVDLLVVSGGATDRMPGPGPWTPGWDVSGTVTAVGPGVDASLIGRTVLGFSQWFRTGNGTHAAQVVLPAADVVVSSGSIGPAELTTFGLNGLTALQAVEAAGVPPHGRIIVVGGDGAVGRFAVQIARARGLDVVAVTRHSDRAAIAPRFADAVVQCAPLDAAVLEAVKDGGTAVSVTRPLPTVRNIASSRVAVRADPAGLRAVVGLAEAGVLQSRVAKTYPIERARDAYRFFADRVTRDRTVLVFD